MSIEVRIVDGPLSEPAAPQAEPAWLGVAGAIVCFEGRVRASENGRSIVALDYEAYEPMAAQELHRLGEQLAREFALIGLIVAHSRGRIAVGECSFRLCIAAGHRKEALQAMDAYIARLKQDVPIWKKPVYADKE